MYQMGDISDVTLTNSKSSGGFIQTAACEKFYLASEEF